MTLCQGHLYLGAYDGHCKIHHPVKFNETTFYSCWINRNLDIVDTDSESTLLVHLHIANEGKRQRDCLPAISII